MNENETRLRNAWPAMLRTLHLTRGALRLLRPHQLDADVAAHVAGLAASNPAMAHVLRSPVEKARITADVRHTLAATRRTAAGVGTFRLREVDQHVADWRSLEHEYRHDVTRSPKFSKALDHVTPDGMIALASYRVAQADRLAKASPATLKAAYAHAFARGDASGLVDAELIEQLAESPGLAKSTADREILKGLRDFISWSQDERVPADLPDFDGLAADVARLRERSAVLNLGPIDPARDTTARQAFDQLADDLLKAGAASDRDDLQAVHATFAEAGR